MSPGSFRQQISSQLGHILRSYVLLMTVILMLLTLAAGYLYQRTHLDRQHALVMTKLGTELSAAGNELEALARSPTMGLGLNDSFGRDSYLAVMLAHLNRKSDRQFMVLDERGGVFLATDTDQARAVSGHPVVTDAVREGRNGMGLRLTEDGVTQVLLVQQAMSKASSQPVGFIVMLYDTRLLAKQLNLDSDILLAFSVGPESLSDMPADMLLQTVESRFVVSAGIFDLDLRVWLGHPMSGTLLLALAVVLISLCWGTWVILRTRSWSLDFADRISHQLEQLLADAHRLLAGETLDQVKRPYDQELSEVVQAINQLLTQQKHLNDQLRTTALVFSTAAEGILVTDTRGSIVDVNPALMHMTGYTRDELVGRPASDLYRGLSRSDKSREISEALALTGRWTGETRFQSRNGQVVPASVSISRIVSGDSPASAGTVSVISDISRLKVAEDQLRELANRDALTHLPNFRHMSDQVNEILLEARGTSRRFAVFFMDLDNFKLTNDHHGHDMGDTLIKAVAQHFLAILPPDHLLCRRSGDEFIAFVEISGQEVRPPALQRLLAQLSPIQVPTDAGMLMVSSTIGVSCFPQDATDWNSLQICANVAMHASKQNRRGSVTWYSPELGKKLLRRQQIQSQLAQAIETGAISMHYQPQIDLRSGQVIGFEALARWTDPQLGVVKPVEFIAAAEEAHLIDALTLHVAQTVLRDKPALQARFPAATLAFNVAPSVVRDSTLLDFLANEKLRREDALEGLEIELAENQITVSDESLQLQMGAFSHLGVRLVIDDFGAGYASLNRLTQLPISRLKISKSFIAGLQRMRQGQIVQLIIHLARNLDFEILAQGIEKSEQREALLRMGCYRGQGWLFAQAMPLEAALALDISWRPLAEPPHDQATLL